MRHPGDEDYGCYDGLLIRLLENAPVLPMT
jgi:hypothetical protein